MDIEFLKTEKALNRTSINLGDFVINPYRGCYYGCLYCYSRFNKVFLKTKKIWGNFVEVKTNIIEILEKELKQIKPRKVLIGSTTDPFQPIEKKYNVTGRILEILNREKINFIILTRSPLVLNYIEFLKNCEKLYFTVNFIDEKLKEFLEPKSPTYEERLKIIKILKEKGINVVPYFSPVIFFLSDYRRIFEYNFINKIEFELLNINLANIKELVNFILKINPELGKNFQKLKNDEVYYNKEVERIKNEILSYAKNYNKKVKIYTHSFKKFFENVY